MAPYPANNRESEAVGRTACPVCKQSGGDWDDDNLVLYDDGHGYCFCCNHYQSPSVNHGNGQNPHYNDYREDDTDTIPTPQSAPKKPAALIEGGDHRALSKRGIFEETCRKFNYTVGRYSGQQAHIAPYYDKHGTLKAQHIRFANKDFLWLGNSKGVALFGQHLWAGNSRRIIITEGEIDCMTVSQLQGNKWPVVSIPSGASAAKKAIQENLEFLESFEEVVLAFDMDEPGRNAVQECAPLFSPGKCRVAHLPRKDANECLQEGLAKELISSLWDAKPFRPDGIVNGADLYDKCKEPPAPGLATPYSGLNERTLGIRPKELWLFTAGSGIGKSTLVNELAYNLHQEHGKALGIIALEESPDRNGRRYLGIHTNRPLHLPGHDLTNEEYDAAYSATIGRGDWWIYEHFGSTDIDGLLAKIRFMAIGCGIKVLVLDHISIVVSGLEEQGESERKTIDRLMTKLRQLVEETSITVLAVVHLKRPKEGKAFTEGRQVSQSDLRGSGSLEQVSDIIVALERDQQGEDSNKSQIRVLKNRVTGSCGTAGYVEYNQETGRLVPAAAPEECPMFTDETQSGKEGNPDF